VCVYRLPGVTRWPIATCIWCVAAPLTQDSLAAAGAFSPILPNTIVGARQLAMQSSSQLACLCYMLCQMHSVAPGWARRTLPLVGSAVRELVRRSINSHARQVAEFKNVNFQTGFGESIQDISVTWETWGDPTLGPDRTVCRPAPRIPEVMQIARILSQPLKLQVVIFPSFSHGPHAASNYADPSPGE